MKHVLFLFYTFLLCNTVQAQITADGLKHPFEEMDDETMKRYLVTFESETGGFPLYRNPPQEGSIDFVKVLSSNYVCYIDEKKDYYIGSYLGKVVYIPKNKAKLRTNLSKATERDMSLIRLASAAKGYKHRFDLIRKVGEAIDSKFLLISPGAEEESLMSPHQNFNFKILNNYKKRIKKVWIEATGRDIYQNALYSPKYRSKTFKISVGPINSGDECSYSFNRVWQTTEWVLVDISSISIVFEDGTGKRISNPKDCILESLYESNLFEYQKFKNYSECDRLLYEDYHIKDVK